MNFRTEILIKKSPKTIKHNQKILLLGSCFAQNMQVKFTECGFDAIHPMGAIYNPYSVANTFKLIKEKTSINPDDLFFQRGLWNSYLFHSSYSHPEQHTALDKMNKTIGHANMVLNSPNTIIIVTLGTSWVYELNSSKEIVANCHHSLASDFTRRCMSVEEIITVLKPICSTPSHIIFTVSPVRHLKDGAHENQLSKSRLLLAIEELCSEYENCEYFPSYEIMLDELRDYRFYADDMAHPTNLAVDYIWEKFSETYFTENTKLAVKEYDKINKKENHRPYNPNSQEYMEFLEKVKEEKNNWILKYKRCEN